MGYGVSAVYNQNGALIIGALEYDIWKTGIIPNECIEVRSGVTDKLTRDTIKHGTVHGEIVKSPVIYIGESRTWQQGMMALLIFIMNTTQDFCGTDRYRLAGTAGMHI